jgi:hypothetical protein
VCTAYGQQIPQWVPTPQKPVCEKIFAVEQLMVKAWADAPKRLLLGVGPGGIIVFTGGGDSYVVGGYSPVRSIEDSL